MTHVLLVHHYVEQMLQALLVTTLTTGRLMLVIDSLIIQRLTEKW